MSTKAREVIWGGRIMGANIHAKAAREDARKAIREADRAEAEAWSVRMEGYGGPAYGRQAAVLGPRTRASSRSQPSGEQIGAGRRELNNVPLS
jgi:hypothetical protein